jgi:hypothetical protein
MSGTSGRRLLYFTLTTLALTHRFTPTENNFAGVNQDVVSFPQSAAST